VTRTVESFTAIPTLILVLIVGAMVPHPTTAILLWTIALTRWTDLARMVRAEVLLALGSDYVTAARALGASPARILRRHVLPNAIGPAIVAAAFGIASVVLIEAAVDFLHVGPADATASWGEALGQARGHRDAWWLIVFPGSALLAMLIALNLVGEAARDALDPRLRGVGEELTEAMRS
jgi:peptide/nickel transport system permease protein